MFLSFLRHMHTFHNNQHQWWIMSCLEVKRHIFLSDESVSNHEKICVFFCKRLYLHTSKNVQSTFIQRIRLLKTVRYISEYIINYHWMVQWTFFHISNLDRANNFFPAFITNLRNSNNSIIIRIGDVQQYLLIYSTNISMNTQLSLMNMNLIKSKWTRR